MGRSKAALLPASSASTFRPRTRSATAGGVSTRAGRSGREAAARETSPTSSSEAGAAASTSRAEAGSQDAPEVSPLQVGSVSEACASQGGPGNSEESSETGEAADEATSVAGTMLDVFGSIPTQMDYKGQKLAEQIFQGIILVSAVIGFIYGYIAEQFGWTVYIVMAGFALSCLLTLPPWPMYRRNPLKWLPVQESGTEDKKPAERKLKRHTKS
ncbi:signal peptidase complex subunit 1 isoform X1 [Dermochelys coriacea]|uniref:signal peptidase complex subunit 1 isoform X1 n=1 Tax=Dermochelys coriacea TaxID=27794 RepID=UPI0018E84975|nr:signal peptidase complex subunit 1 isoform X1 [Dermochelys coriacea]